MYILIAIVLFALFLAFVFQTILDVYYAYKDRKIIKEIMEDNGFEK